MTTTQFAIVFGVVCALVLLVVVTRAIDADPVDIDTEKDWRK